MCINPIKITNKGKYKEDTYRGKKGEEYYIETFTKCGRCSQCIAEKANNWVIRNNYEAKAHKKICFITLTYAETPPYLVKKDFQDWIKRFRRYLEYHKLMPIKEYKQKINKKTGEIKLIPIYENIRYFGCGEYGTKYHRPHGHFIIYNWEEERNNLKYLDINKKGNIILQSKIIQETWGLGRTTYQIFNAYEIPYISLYNTPQETTFKGYILTRKKIKEFQKKYKEEFFKLECDLNEIKQIMKKEKKLKKPTEKYYKELNIINKRKDRLKILIKDIQESYRKLDKEKAKSILIKEFNMWSIGIGWKMFEKEYDKYKDCYDFNEYVENATILTPSSWVKKLANRGDKNAIKEMLSRTAELAAKGNEYDLQSQNRIKKAYDKVDEIIDFANGESKIIL